MTELKPCPFCGGEAVICTDSLDGFWAECGECQLELYETEAEAIAAWNRRADGWISVDERLPESFINVLVWDGHCIEVADYDFSYDEWSLTVGGTVAPTHWQPLPLPPE